MRLAVRLLAALAALLLVALLVGVLLIRQGLAAAGIDELAWDGLGWSAGALQVDSLSATLTNETGAQLEIQAHGLYLEPIWSGGPHLAVLQIGQMQLDWQPLVGLPASRSPGFPDMQQLAGTLRWLPSDFLALPQVQIQMPCGFRRCTLNGGMSVTREAAGRFALELLILTEEGRIELDGSLHSDTKGLQADLNLQLGGEQAASVRGQWLYGETAPRSQGVLTVPGWPQADWLLAYAHPWLGNLNPAVTSLPTGLEAEARWTLEPLERPQTLAELLTGKVGVRIDLALAVPWRIPDLGAVAGDVQLDLLGDTGLWQLREGRVRLQLADPDIPDVLALPTDVRPQTVNIDIQAQADSELDWTSQLPLVVEVGLEGPVTASLTGPVQVMSKPTWLAQWEAMRLSVDAERLDLGSLRVDQLRLNWPFAGRVDMQQLDMQLGQGAIISMGSAQAEDLGALHNARADLSGLALQIPFAEPSAATASGPLIVTAGRVEHAALKPQRWSLQGTVTRNNTELRWKGSVAAASDLGLDVAFHWPAGSSWSANFTLQPLFLRAGDPLAGTLADWPELLTLGSGRILGRINLHGAKKLERASGGIELDAVAGIYDRLTFEGLSTAVTVDLAGDRLQFDMPTLTLRALDAGVPMGPLDAEIHYAAHVSRPLAGLVTIEQAELEVLGGQVAIEPAILDLAGDRHTLIIDMRGVQLDRLFAAYPAEGLQGRGTLDGRLPVTLIDGQLMIDEGELDARAPGGSIQYRSDKLENLAESTPGMRQVVQALDDFRYDRLSADVSYRPGGILVLGLELQGHNPDVQDGRPIHLNVRLEEDIPALLASLQLSGKVSEVIQERVRQRLLQQRADP